MTNGIVDAGARQSNQHLVYVPLLTLHAQTLRHSAPVTRQLLELLGTAKQQQACAQAVRHLLIVVHNADVSFAGAVPAS